MKKVMIAAGGTGGHIYPGLALAEVLIEKNPGLEVVFIGSSSRMEATLIPSAGYRFIGIEVKSTYGGLWNKVESAVSMIKEERECADILQKEKPDAVVGFGNYISVPVITAAHRLHIPTMISEQNSFMGKANRYLVRYADAVEAAYPSSIEGIAKARCLGNPQATHAILQAPHPELLEAYGLNPLRPFVFVMMGSLGSDSVSAAVDDALGLLDPDFQVLIAAGKANDYHFVHAQNANVHIVEFVNGSAMLRQCDLAVLRAGATTLAEAAALGTAAILIPSPYVPNNHQVYNAREFVNAGAAEMIEEKDLSGERLADAVNRLMKDEAARTAMSLKAKTLARPDAAETTADWLMEIAHERA